MNVNEETLPKENLEEKTTTEDLLKKFATDIDEFKAEVELTEEEKNLPIDEQESVILEKTIEAEGKKVEKSIKDIKRKTILGKDHIKQLELERLAEEAKNNNLNGVLNSPQMKVQQSINKVMNQLENIDSFECLKNKKFLVCESKEFKNRMMELKVSKKFNKKSKKDLINKIRNEVIERAENKLAKNRKYTYYPPTKARKILHNSLPEGRKFYSSIFMEILCGFINYCNLNENSVFLAQILTNIKLLEDEDYDEKFLQRIVDFIESFEE